MTGIFISLEGPDGSGKSTAAKQLAKQLPQLLHKAVLLTREPGGSSISEKIRQLILDVNNQQMDAHTEALLYAAQRRQHLVDVIQPALAQGQLVLSDRYVDSSIAYQGAGRQLGTDEVWQINQFATQNVMPQLTLYFDVAPEVGLARIKQQRATATDRLEQETLAFHQRVHQAYLKLWQQNPQRIKKIDATQTPAAVVAACLQEITTVFTKEG